MKSALFESLNDRSNITNAYIKMVNESVEEDASTIEEPIEVAIPDWAVSYIEYVDDSGLNDEDKKIVDEYIDGIAADGLHLSYDGEELGFVRHPEFGLASNCIKFYLMKDTPKSNESVEEDEIDEDEGWFSPQGELIKEIPQECVDACTKSGADAYDDCKFWVDELGFDKGLDIAQAKGFLKSTGGWEANEIAAFDPKETAIRLLWIICGDLKDGSDLIYIGDAEPFVEESVDVKKVKVAITGIVWPKGSNGLPERDSITIELSDGDDIEERVGQELEVKHKVAPESFKVAKVVEINADDFTNEIIDQKELDKLTKKYDIINEKR